MALLEVTGLCAGYGAADVLRDVSFSVEQGGITAILGGRVVMVPHQPRGSQFLLYLPAAAGAPTEPVSRARSAG